LAISFIRVMLPVVSLSLVLSTLARAVAKVAL
jgi:hypothetical protein